MKRFIDLRHTDIGDFAFYDTIIDVFEEFSGICTWDNKQDFTTDCLGDNGDELDRYLGLMPSWVPINEEKT